MESCGPEEHEKLIILTISTIISVLKNFLMKVKIKRKKKNITNYWPKGRG